MISVDPPRRSIAAEAETAAACPLCGSAMRSKFAGIAAEETGATFEVDHCPDCGLGRTRPSPVDLAPYYGPGYHGKRHGPTARLCNRRRLGMVRRRFGRGSGRSLLDFGCGDGDFLAAARADGWDAVGVERAEMARLGPGVVADLDDLGESDRFDCATFWHVLEHLEDPVGTLDRLRGHLKPGAQVIAAVPNFGSWQARAIGKSWLHLDLPRHLWHFTAASLARTFEAAGYGVEAMATGEWEYDVVGWSQGLLDLRFGGRGEFFRLMSGRPIRASKPRLAAQVVAGLGLAMMAAGPAWVEGKLGRGGTLIATARVIGDRAAGDA